MKLISYMPNGRARIVRLHAVHSLVGLSSLYKARYEHTAITVGYVEAECIPAGAGRLPGELPFGN